MKHYKTLNDMKAEKIAETLANSLGHVHCKALLYKMAATVAELHVTKSADRLCDVKALAPVDVLAYMLACKKEHTHAATPEVMWRLTHCSRRWLTG